MWNVPNNRMQKLQYIPEEHHLPNPQEFLLFQLAKDIEICKVVNAGINNAAILR